MSFNYLMTQDCSLGPKSCIGRVVLNKSIVFDLWLY